LIDTSQPASILHSTQAKRAAEIDLSDELDSNTLQRPSSSNSNNSSDSSNNNNNIAIPSSRSIERKMMTLAQLNVGDSVVQAAQQQHKRQPQHNGNRGHQLQPSRHALADSDDGDAEEEALERFDFKRKQRSPFDRKCSLLSFWCVVLIPPISISISLCRTTG
jgi:hypothetical protein